MSWLGCLRGGLRVGLGESEEEWEGMLEVEARVKRGEADGYLDYILRRDRRRKRSWCYYLRLYIRMKVVRTGHCYHSMEVRGRL
jgi:hypothetical protein